MDAGRHDGSVHGGGSHRSIHPTVLRPAHATRGASLAMVSKEQLDAESDYRLMEALGLLDDEVEEADEGEVDWSGYDMEAEDDLEKSTDVPSHLQLDYTEDGEPTLLRFAYVDEVSCIGCTYCADVARNTFYMNDDAGRARVFHQGGDSPELIAEAIDACLVSATDPVQQQLPAPWRLSPQSSSRVSLPSAVRLTKPVPTRPLQVNCIMYVDLEDLVTLETEREGMVINPGRSASRRRERAMNALPPTKAKLGGSGALRAATIARGEAASARCTAWYEPRVPRQA